MTTILVGYNFYQDVVLTKFKNYRVDSVPDTIKLFLEPTYHGCLVLACSGGQFQLLPYWEIQFKDPKHETHFFLKYSDYILVS